MVNDSKYKYKRGHSGVKSSKVSKDMEFTGGSAKINPVSKDFTGGKTDAEVESTNNGASEEHQEHVDYKRKGGQYRLVDGKMVPLVKE